MTPWDFRRRARHLVAATTTMSSMALDDPAWLTVQVARKAPAALRNRVGGWATRRGAHGAAAVWGELLLDRPGRARQHLAARTRLGPLTRALAVHAGQPPGPATPAADQARWAWLTGDLTAARSLLEQPSLAGRVRTKVAGDIAALEPGPRPAPNTAPRSWTPSPERPSVLHVLTNSLPWTRSGYALRTHAVLQAQQAVGIEVTALTRPGYPVSIGRVLSRDADVVDDIGYHRCVPLRLELGEARRVDRWAEQLVQLAREQRVSHLHSTTHYPNALAAQAAAAALDLPWVHEVRGQLERTWASTRHRAGDPTPYLSERFLAWRAKEGEVAAAADHVITLSETMRTDLIERGVAPDRISVVANGIEAPLLQRSSTPAEARRRLGLPTEGVWVGALSSVVHYEGLIGLVEAVARLREQGSDVRGFVVGDGVAWPDLARRVAELGLDEVFLLPGRLPRGTALQWLDALDVAAVPREDHEVTRLVPPLKLVEAMGAARPVIASELPALAEIVRPGESGLLVPPHDPEALAAALRTLAEDPALRARLGAQGREVAAERTWAKLAQTYRKVYETTDIGSTQGRRPR